MPVNDVKIKIFVIAKPNARRVGVEKIDETHLIVSVKEPPREGRANYAVLEALARHLNVSLSNIRLVSGATSRQKVFEIF